MVMTGHCPSGLGKGEALDPDGIVERQTGSATLVALPWPSPSPGMHFPLFIDFIHCKCPHGATRTGGTMTVVMSHLKTRL